MKLVLSLLLAIPLLVSAGPVGRKHNDEELRLNGHGRRCEKPAVRQEWRSLSKDERGDWISAVNCLAHTPHDPRLTASVDPDVSLIPPIDENSSLFDDFTYLHMDLNTKIHWTGYFIFWHRLLVHKFEEALKENCGYTGAHPYWDWTLDAADIANATIWDADPISGLGLSTGDLSNDITLTTGGFANLSLAYPSRHTLRRNLTEQPFLVLGNLWPDNPEAPLDFFMHVNYTITADYVENIVDGYRGDFKGFQGFFEGPTGPHGAPHWYLGGDSSSLCPENYTQCNSPGPKWSNNDPMFYLHHVMVDKIYSDWQHRDPANFYSFEGGATQNLTSWDAYSTYPNGAAPWLDFGDTIPGDGLWDDENITFWDIIDTQAGLLCYVYE